jgi:hypothetical protein
MLGAEPMTVPHSGIQYAHPWSWKELGGLFRLAASACVVMPIAAQTTAVIAIIRATVMLSPVVGPASGGLTSKTGRIDVAQTKNYTGREVQLRFVGRMSASSHIRSFRIARTMSALPPSVDR